MTITPYEILNVTDAASPEEIRHAYRRLAKRWHPDRCPGDPSAAPRFRAIKAAYEAVLREKRPATAERILWQATRDGETIVLTSTRLLHRHGRHSREVPLHDVREVLVGPHSRASEAVLLILTATAAHSITLPRPFTLRLAELLTVRAS